MEDAPIAILKVNVKKAYIADIINIGIIVASIIGVLIFLNIVVGLDVFIETFAMFGINISKLSIVIWGLCIAILGTAMVLIKEYINVGNSTYTIFEDRLRYKKSSLFLPDTAEEIPYSNIVKIRFERQGIIQSLNLVLELSAMTENNITIAYLDNPKETAEKLQKLILEHKASRMDEIREKKEIDEIISN